MGHKLLITGANGFVGSALCNEAVAREFNVRAVTRTSCHLASKAENVVVGTLDETTDWTEALAGIDVVIHLAARVHVMRDTAPDPGKEFLKVNLHGTVNLARQAARVGVKRLVYVSSIKVNGEQTAGAQPFTAADEANPQNIYAFSKWQAEQALQQIALETGLEIVIVRPPLTYGPGVKGNFLRLLQAVYKGIPLPLANVHNARSLLYLENLVDVLLLCATHPAAAGKTYLLQDGKDISMVQLVRYLGDGMEKIPILFPMPIKLLRGMAVIVGQKGALDRLGGSLRIDDSHLRQELGWEPKFTQQQGLRATAAWYREERQPSSEPVLPKRNGNAGPVCPVSIVIVNYNAGAILQDCVAQALQQAEQIIVVDNASNDGSIEMLKKSYPAMVVIDNEHNLGFAKACNQGARLAEGENILFLNPDCILEEGAVQKLLEAVHGAADVGMVGGLLTNPDGSEQGGGRREVPTPWRSLVRVTGLSVLSNRYPKLFSDFALHKQPLPERPMEVEAISGACMLVRRTVMEQVGLLDEGYFMHCEDLDWCMRFRREGWKLLFVPDARMVHHKGHCSKARPIFVEWNKHKGMLRFYHKFFRHQYPGVLMVMVTCSVWMRFALVAGHHALHHMLRHLNLRRG